MPRLAYEWDGSQQIANINNYDTTVTRSVFEIFPVGVFLPGSGNPKLISVND